MTVPILVRPPSPRRWFAMDWVRRCSWAIHWRSCWLLSPRCCCILKRITRHHREIEPARFDIHTAIRGADLYYLPVLPDKNFGPYGAINPYQIWLMVVLISGVSLPAMWHCNDRATPWCDIGIIRRFGFQYRHDVGLRTP